jgi:hypothetical protein
VLAGLALFERQTFFLTKDIEAIQDKHFPNKPPICSGLHLKPAGLAFSAVSGSN